MRSVARILALAIVAVFITLFSFYAVFPTFGLTDDHRERKPSSVLLQEWEEARDKASALRFQDDQVVPEDKIVVIGKLSNEDTQWVERELPDWHSAVYTVNDTTAPLHTPVNKGHESLAYLTYLVDNYNHLPSVIAFVHAHKDGFPQAWHVDSWGNSNVRMLRDLNTDYIRKSGYANLRCNTEPGCPSWIKPHRGANEPTGEKEMLTAWAEIFGADAEAPETLAAACCAQFAVSKEQVWARPLSDYVRWREWVLNSQLDDETIGRIWEYLWHVVFGRGPVFCPLYKKCQCQLYGRFCNR